MRIVRADRPPGMVIVFDPIIMEPIHLAVSPSHPVQDRVDYVYVGRNIVGILHSVNGLIPVPLPDTRLIARVFVHSSVTAILDSNIEEL